MRRFIQTLSTTVYNKGEEKSLGCSSLVAPQFGAVDPPDVEVLHVDVPVGGSLPLAPQQQTLLGRGLCRVREGGGERFRNEFDANVTVK